MMEKIKTLLPITLLGLMTSCAAQTNTFQVQDELVAEKEITVAYFNQLNFSGGGDLFLSRSPEAGLKIVGSSACMSLVATEMSSNSLVIRQKNNHPKDCKLKFYVNTSEIVSIQQSGGGNVEFDQNFESIDSFRYVLNGGGTVDMTAIKVNSFHAMINGGGNMTLHVDKELKATINGGGTVTYQGNPEVISNVAAGGSVTKIDQ